MKLSIFYAHSKFWGNPSVFGAKIAKQTAKTTYDKILMGIFGSSRPSTKIKYHRWIRRQKLNPIHTNFFLKDQLQNLT